MPITLTLYMIGAFAISAVPLFSGFVSKSMVVSAAGESHLMGIFLALTMASSGTFLHTGLKLPYYMFFGKDSGLRPPEPPRNMLIGMGIAAAACVVIGVLPSVLYASLPFPVEYHPYTPRHVTNTLGLLGFTALGFFMLLKQLDPHPSISVDTDWFYRKGTAVLLPRITGTLGAIEGVVGNAYNVVMQKLVLGVGGLLRILDARVVDAGLVGIGTLTEKSSGGLRKTVTGNAQYYGLVMAVGVLVVMALAVFGG